ncbi:MAG TPA: 50S ribosomal protein L13 [Oligoflexia bacterium]|nr:50S ribosomal protein L13 [Oligoflexia bacterium]HMP49780.1 50S ribosomal protein L13 [Oligoflexia bacterium]
MSTEFQTKEEALASRKWVVVDAENQVVGRLASKIAYILRGKHKPTFAPHNDGGDYVVVINADKVRFTGNKEADKMFHYHTGFVGGVKSSTAAEIRGTHPERLLEIAVKGMLPKSALGKNMISKLKIYSGSEHPHAAQCPVVV